MIEDGCDGGNDDDGTFVFLVIVVGIVLRYGPTVFVSLEIDFTVLLPLVEKAEAVTPTNGRSFADAADFDSVSVITETVRWDVAVFFA